MTPQSRTFQIPGDTLLAFALSTSIFILYALGACRTIYVGDSGELVTAVHLLGIPHPSGYPLYVLLGKLWCLLLPFGSVAFRMSLFSAAFAAAACGLLYRLGRELNLRVPASVFAALLLAFSPSFWSQANIQRVYSLNAFFVVLVTLVALRWYRQRKDSCQFSTLNLSFFLCGLGASNHTFMVLYALALGVFVLTLEPSLLLQPLRFIRAAGAFCLGLLPYLYLPLRSMMDPRLDWGNPETPQNFFNVILRRDFWERKWMEGPSDLLPVASDFFTSLGLELAWAGAAFAVVGIVAGRYLRIPVIFPILIIIGNFLAVALHGSRTDIFIWHRYYIPAYSMACLLAGIGCHKVIQRFTGPAAFLPLLVPVFLLCNGWEAHDRSRYRIAEDFSRKVLRSLPPKANLIATNDNILFVLIYLHMVENLRPDINLILQGVGGAHLPPLKFNPDTNPLFLTNHPNWSLPELAIVPMGVVFQTWRAKHPLPEPVIGSTQLEGENDPRVPKDYLTQNLIGHFHYMLGVTLEQKDWLKAREQYRLAAEIDPNNDALFYNLGLIYRRNGWLEEAQWAFRRSHAINPRHLASESRPRAGDRLKEIQRERNRLLALESRLYLDPSLDLPSPGTPAYHRRMAELLFSQGEETAARGHILRAMEETDYNKGIYD